MNQPSFIYLVVKNKEGGEGSFKERDGFKKTLPPLEKCGGGGVYYRGRAYLRGGLKEDLRYSNFMVNR